jgi:hypothetical protein
VIDDVVEGREDAVREPVIAHELPDVFGGVEFGRARRQEDDRDVRRPVEPVGDVPARLIDEEEGVRVRGDGERYLVEMQAHRLGVAERQDQARGLALGRADRAEDVGRAGPLIVRRRRPCVPRIAQRRVRLFFWPTRASSANHTSIRLPAARRCAMSATIAGKLF